MRRIVLAALSIALLPGIALAQEAPAAAPPPAAPAGAPGEPGGWNPERFAAMRQTHAQITQLHEQTRAAMLSALSPLHRNAIANLIGQFAISANPDARTLGRQIDAVLTRGEAQNVVNLAAAERTNARGIEQAARAQFAASLSADERAEMAAREQKMEAARAQHVARTPDPGLELVRTLVEGVGHRPEGPGGPGGPGPEGRPS